MIGFTSILLIGSGVVGLTSFSKASDSLKAIYETNLVPITQLGLIVRLIDRNRMVIAESMNGDPAIVNQQMEEVNRRTGQINNLWAKFMAGNLSVAEKRLADQVAIDRKKFEEEGLTPAIDALRSANAQQAMEVMQGPMRQLYQPVQDDIDAMIRLLDDDAKQEFVSSQSRYVLIRNVSVGMTLFGVLLGIGMGIWLVRSIVGPLAESVRFAKGVAAGDLTQQINSNTTDEIGQLLQALKEMTESLSVTVGNVRAGTETIGVASREIASGNADLSSRTESQASALEETASSMEELTSTVKQNADNARQANQLVISASDVALRGGQVVGQVVETMDSIKASSRKIVDIISVIDGIAFQTNILALNAAVEAARAGEQGRGFAVVATEVRNLAQRSASAAKEIKTLISDSVDKVEAGDKLVHEAGNTMGEIVTSVRHVADIMTEIASASQEQSAGIEQVNRAITQMDEMTQQNAALVEQAAAAAESMQEQAALLGQSVAVFTLVGGASTVTDIGPRPLVPRSVAPRSMAKLPSADAVVWPQTTQRNVTAPLVRSKPVAARASTNDDWEEF